MQAYEMNIYEVNPNITTFYFGGDTDPDNPNLNVAVEDNWVVGACESLGVASYAIHNGDAALIYDTLCYPDQANLIRAHMSEKLGINKFTVAVSHWHLDHVGGNELYKDCNIIGTRKTREYMLRYKPEIEAGTLWGQPAINPLREPDITFDTDVSVYLNGLEVRLYNFDIHTDDGLCAFIPKYKTLLPGDMLEDSASFVTNPEAIPAHVKNFKLLRELGVEKILPNHGRSFVIRDGGYDKELIDCVEYYLNTLYTGLERDPDAKIAPLQEFLKPYFAKGLIHYWHPYETVHQNNTERVRAFFKNTWKSDGRLTAD